VFCAWPRAGTVRSPAASAVGLRPASWAHADTGRAELARCLIGDAAATGEESGRMASVTSTALVARVLWLRRRLRARERWTAQRVAAHQARALG